MQASAALRRWLQAAHGRDTVERRQAVLLQSILIVLIVAVALLTVLTTIVPELRQDTGQVDVVLAVILVELLFIVPLWLLRIGHFAIAATAIVAVFEFIVIVGALSAGAGTPGIGAAFAIPMTIAALVLRRPGLVAATAVAIGAVVVLYTQPGQGTPASGVVNLVVTLGILGIVLDRFGVSLREALSGELRHHREAEEARASLMRQAEELAAANRRLTREMSERALAEEGRRAIEAKVLEVQKLESLGVLAGGIAHDFNNLLVAILGNAGLALLDLPEDSPARASIIDIEVASRRAAELARQMLAYSGRSRFHVEPVELAELVRELLTLLQVSIGKGVVLKLHLPDEPIVVDADAAQLRQVVMNLVINASDAIADRSGIITIRVHRVEATLDYLADAHPDTHLAAGHYAALEVADTGIGMDEATRARIFDPFFTTKFTGRGLGLAAVMGIVRGHHGALRVYSELGRGSTFRIVLPLSASSPLPPVGREEPWRGTGRVLVVDDDPMVRNVARRLLESFGLTVRSADGGPAAVDMVLAEPDAFDGVLLDMTMPELSGPEVLERIRLVRPDLPVVLMSGYHGDELAPELRAGVSGFVQKPFTPADLARWMRAALEGADGRDRRAAAADESMARAADPSTRLADTPVAADVHEPVATDDR